MQPVFVTGNAHKARYFSQMVGLEIEHMTLELAELQSLSLAAIIEHKVRNAYEKIQRPVIVEDTSLSFHAFGRLPGPFIKYFLDEIGVDGVCDLLSTHTDKSAIAGAMIAYYDGTQLEIFEKCLSGTIADRPRGESGFGWNRIFIPDGCLKTLGEMSDSEFQKWYKKIKPFEETASFLKAL